MAEKYICREPDELLEVAHTIAEGWNWEKPLQIEWKRVSLKRSLGQNALFHKWCTLLANFLTAASHEVGNPQVYTMAWVKTKAKRTWGVIEEVPDPETGELTPYLKSTADYTTGEMYFCMQGLEEYAAGLGCLFPVYGEYEELRNEQEGRNG